MHRTMPLFFAILLGAASTPAHPQEDQTQIATQNFLSALSALDASMQHFREVVKQINVPHQNIEPICYALNPDSSADSQQNSMGEASLSELLTQSNISHSDAKTLCAALAAERSDMDKAKAANLSAAQGCAQHRIPACDKINEVLAAQAAARAKDAQE